MRNKIYKVELRSDEVQDILSRPPHVLIRYGISIICFISALLLAGCFIFRYPETIQGDIVITTENPPVWVVSKSAGSIKEFYKADKERVEQGELIAVVENTAQTKDVLTVKMLLLSNSCISDSTVCVDTGLFTNTFELGELQSAFSALIKTMNNYNNFLSLNLLKQEEISLNREIAGRESYLTSLKTELALKKREETLAKLSYEREKALFESGVISKSELEYTEQNYLHLQQASQQLQSNIVSQSVENSKLKNSVSKLNLEYLQDKNNKYSDLLTAYRELISEIEKWEQLYLLKTPQSGTITFNSYWTKNQDVKVSDRVFAVIPENQGDIIGKLKMPITGAGKVNPGQLVNIKVEGYPYLEYGVLQGRVRNISLVANENFYTVEVRLISGMYSTIGVDFNFTGELSGLAEIVTENRTIADRILSPLKYIWANHFR